MADDFQPPRFELDPSRLRHGYIDEAKTERAELPVKAHAFDNLAEAAPHYLILNHGLLFTHGGLDPTHQDPVAALCDATGAKVAIMDMPMPLFEGIARDASEEVWDRRLIVAPRAIADQVLGAIAAVHGFSKADGTFYRAVPQLARIVDVSLVAAGRYDRLRPPPTVPITLVGLRGNKASFHFESRFARKEDRARVVRTAPDEAMVRIGRRVFGDHNDPFLPGGNIRG